MINKELKIGIVEPGIRHASANEPATLDQKFALAKQAEVFDYIDMTPLADQVNEVEACANRHDIPVLAGSCNYILGLEEEKLERNLKIGAALGSIRHNTQVFMDHADGHLISNDEVMAFYLEAHELGEKLGCIPTFETHVNMWSECFTRVNEVADMVRARGVPFRITLDHSHLIFKIDNPNELAVFGVDKLLEQGQLILEPERDGNVFDSWIDQGLVAHAHARATVPNNPKNRWAAHPDINNLRSSLHPKDVIGRGIQYPFFEPAEGEWHSPWHAESLAPWKAVMKKLLRHHWRTPDSELKTISTEFIPFTDYGEGSSYSLLEHNAACARWLKETWANIQAVSVC